MHDAERDHLILSTLDSSSRAKIEETVDEIIDEELPFADRAHLLAAARSFDERSDSLPVGEKLVAMQVAAVLRARVLGEVTIH